MLRLRLFILLLLFINFPGFLIKISLRPLADLTRVSGGRMSQ